MVVAGDAAIIAKPLSHFAKVVVIDPEHDFQPGQTLPLDPTQPLEVPGAPATVPVTASASPVPTKPASASAEPAKPSPKKPASATPQPCQGGTKPCF